MARSIRQATETAAASCLAAAVATALTASMAQAQTQVQSSMSYSSTITQAGGGSSSLSSSSVTLGASGQRMDIRIVNGTVWINGERIPEGVTRWAQDGSVFHIHRQGGQVTVTTE